MMRDNVWRLVGVGPLPSTDSAIDEEPQSYQDILDDLYRTGVTDDEEARLLVGLFGPDDCYGLAWTLVHIIERAPGWPLTDCLAGAENEWVQLLTRRAERT